MQQEIEKWKPLESETVFEKYSRGIKRVDFEMPDKKKEDYYIAYGNNSMGILAVTEDNEIVLAKQFRPGPDKVLLEMPGGAIEDGEDIRKAAERELLEETGYAGDMEIIGKSFDDAYSRKERFCAVARNCKKIGEQKLDSTEFIEVVLVSLPEFRELLRSGEMTDVEIGYMALDHLGLL
ncbi:MAG: NUDIX hydrolase [Candidatus Moranbacteria bacterium]|nr:NUDIX hydrolase [Candidatus Moranbacteria bacterium]